MSDSFSETQDNSEVPLPPDLPPVEPPSAKFIVQLFVVPGLIVAAIVGAWWLFGKLASSEQDWQALVQDLKSGNEHRRGRGAMGLAQALVADRQRTGDGPRLATNPQVAQELSAYFAESLKSSSQEPSAIDQQAFLARTLGMLDVPDVVLPALREGLQAAHDREVRKNSLLAVATIAHHAHERGVTLSAGAIVAEVANVAKDADPLLRSSAAFTLGLFPLDATKQPLTVLLSDSDANTRVNAAIAFTRQKSLDGLPVLRDVLTAAASTKTPAPSGDSSVIAASNALKGVSELAPLLDLPTRADLVRDIETISKSYPEPRVRLDAAQALTKLRGQ